MVHTRNVFSAQARREFQGWPEPADIPDTRRPEPADRLGRPDKHHRSLEPADRRVADCRLAEESRRWMRLIRHLQIPKSSFKN